MEFDIEQELTKGLDAYRAYKLDLAKSYFQAVILEDVRNPTANHYLGVILMSRGKINSALKHLKSALENRPTEVSFWYEYIKALKKVDRLESASQVHKQAVKMGFTDENLAKIGVQLADVDNLDGTKLKFILQFRKDKRFNDAIIEVRKLINKYPKSYRLHNLLGLLYFDLGHISAAMASFKDSLSIKPDYVEAYFNLGNLLKDIGEFERAVVAYNKALNINSEFASAYLNKGVALQGQLLLVDALEAYEEAIIIEPNNVAAYNNKADLLRYFGQNNKALDACKKGLCIEPDNALLLNTIGNVYKDLGEFGKATNAYSKAYQIDNSYTEPYANSIELLKLSSAENIKSNIALLQHNKVQSICKTISVFETSKVISEKINAAILWAPDNTSRTTGSQIYNHNALDLNCGRHHAIFKAQNIIPGFCFDCFKVQIQVDDLISLIKLTKILYEYKLGKKFTTKTFIELRSEISGAFKGLVYCRSLNEAKFIETSLRDYLKSCLGFGFIIEIKRGCSEFALKFPDYVNVKDDDSMMEYPSDWTAIEAEFDIKSNIRPKEKLSKTSPNIGLSDILVIQKWIDYAKGLGDPMSSYFDNLSILHRDVYELAKQRVATGLTRL